MHVAYTIIISMGIDKIAPAAGQGSLAVFIYHGFAAAAAVARTKTLPPPIRIRMLLPVLLSAFGFFLRQV